MCRSGCYTSDNAVVTGVVVKGQLTHLDVAPAE